MLLGDGKHLVTDVAVGHNVVAQKNQEVLPCHSVGGRANGVAKPLLVLITEVDRHTTSMGDGVGISILATLAQQVLERTIGLEVAQQLGLARRGDDNSIVDLIGVERLLNDVLDDRFVEHGSISLGVHLVPGRKRVPRPAAGMIAFMLFKDPFAGAGCALCVRHGGRRPNCDTEVSYRRRHTSP